MANQGSLAVNRSARVRVSTQIYTPSKANTTVRNYAINEKRMAQKMVDATLRDKEIDLEMKHGNLIIQLTPACFLHFNEAILQHFLQHDTYIADIHERFDKSKKLVERSVSIKGKDNRKLQLFRINIYHTTMNLEINGRQMQLFMPELKKIIDKLKNVQGLDRLNALIREKCTY